MWSSPECCGGKLNSKLQIELSESFLHEIMAIEGLSRKFRNSVLMASWNGRSLVENAGDVCIRRRRPHEALANPHAIDRKLDLLVKESRWYHVSVGAIQETKWFGNDTWQAEGYTFCTQVDPCPVMARMLPGRRVLDLHLMKGYS